MGSITVVNLTDSPISSAITVRGYIHSGINGILPNVYYHHQALPGTGYDLWEKWYLPPYTEPFESSEITKIALIITGGVIALAGLVAAVAALPTLIPALSAYTTALGTLNTVAVAGTTADLIAAAAVVSTTGYTLLYAAGVTIGGGVVALVATFGIAPLAIVDYIAALKKRVVEGVGGGENRILSFTGNVPLKVGEGKDAQGNPTLILEKPVGMTAETADPPTYNGDLTLEDFDGRRKRGEIYQIKHRDGVYGDMTQFEVRKNLREPLDNRFVTLGGLALDISKIYRIFLWNGKENRSTGSCLMAGEDEDDHKVYLRQGPLEGELSHCSWQFIPTMEQGGGWIIVDRRYVRFLYWTGIGPDSTENDRGRILQYHSQEVGEIKIVNGWAVNVTKKGMVWNLQTFYPVPIGNQVGVIEQPGMDRICVTGRTDLHQQIYAREYRAIYSEPTPDVFQHWMVTVDW